MDAWSSNSQGFERRPLAQSIRMPLKECRMPADAHRMPRRMPPDAHLDAHASVGLQTLFRWLKSAETPFFQRLTNHKLISHLSESDRCEIQLVVCMVCKWLRERDVSTSRPGSCQSTPLPPLAQHHPSPCFKSPRAPCLTTPSCTPRHV